MPQRKIFVKSENILFDFELFIGGLFQNNKKTDSLDIPCAMLGEVQMYRDSASLPFQSLSEIFGDFFPTPV